MVVDLPHPAGHSVNDGIEPELCSHSYASIDDAAAIVTELGRGTILAKLDLENAYRIIPVHPDDRWLRNWKAADMLTLPTFSLKDIYRASRWIFVDNAWGTTESDE